MERFANLRLIAGEVVPRDQTVASRHIAHEHLRSFTLVELSRPVLGNSLERSGENRLPENVSPAIHFAVVPEDVDAHRELLEAGAFFRKFPNQLFADGKTLFGEADGGLHH